MKNFKLKGLKLFRKVVTPLLIIVVFFSLISFSQEASDRPMTGFWNSPKLNSPEKVLRDFMAGKSTTHVIVNLVEATENASRDINQRGVRQQLQQEVCNAQDRVINALHPDHVRITNRFTYIFGFSAEVTQQGLQDLTDNPYVFSIDEDMEVYALTSQGIPLINASTVRNTYNGSGIAIAICDTGIDYSHPRLGNGGFPNNKVIGGYDTGQNDADPMDKNGHGTACAGIAAGNLGTSGDYIGGVAYKAKLYALKITDSTTGGSSRTSDMVEAWEWCVTHQNDDPANPIMIISTSFGGGRYYNQASCDSSSSALATAAANAKALGITLFAAAGNDGYCDSTNRPGCMSDVIGVGAVYDSAFGKYYPCVSMHSCATKNFTFGCSTWYYATDKTAADKVTSYSNSASFISLFAPANKAYTLTAGGGYDKDFGGTSAACPYAAGAGACLQCAAKEIIGNYLSPEEVESYLSAYGDLVTDKKIVVTKPRVNLGNAVDALLAYSPITVTSPNGGENWTSGTSENITWTTVGKVGNVKIQYSTNNGSSWSNVTSSTTNDGKYSWTVPNVSSSQCLVRVSKASTGTPSDTSDAVFTISSTPPGIALDQSVLYFTAIISGPQTGSQEVWVNNSGGGTLNWSASDNASWLTCSPASGTNSGVVIISVNSTGLAAGSYSGTITFSAAGVTNPPTVTVNLTVKNASQDQPPFGEFATPISGSTVYGSIPVTGWVLDDVEVMSVKIYNGTNYFGDAVFVKGTRPDVEQAYPGYPKNYRAGWGYMLLTNFLPNQGNGTYIIHAKAVDTGGKVFTLGSKTIKADNDNAVKPFGAIDTPTQGGIASGASFINWGWALTPQPKMIPTDGSTINVYVDGVNLGHPTYNKYRSDIATLLPGYANSNGAVGLFYLDTTAYENGVHTIQWTATDNQGVTDGIGSRYFTIQNTGGFSSVSQNKALLNNQSSTIKIDPVNLSQIPIDYSKPVVIIKGYINESISNKIYPNDKGIIDIRISELEPLEIHFNTLDRSGFQVIGDQLRALPIGSTFDISKGVFYWRPGPGFIGEYDLVFISTNYVGEKVKKIIRIEIQPKFRTGEIR